MINLAILGNSGVGKTFWSEKIPAHYDINPIIIETIEDLEIFEGSFFMLCFP